MRQFLLSFLGSVAVVFPSLAEDFRDVSRPCRVERLDTAYAACVDLLSDQRELVMDGSIAQSLSGLQAATGPELRALETRYRLSQESWRWAIEQGCSRAFSEDPRGLAECRLQAVLARDMQLATSLERLRYDLGGPEFEDIPVPDSVEVFVPLPPGMTGPRRRVRVPLTVPIRP